MSLVASSLVITVLFGFSDATSVGLPEAAMTTPQIIRHHGYPAEVHHITTEDGYILEMHRIPFSKQENGRQRDEQKPVVLLQHGFIGSSAVWVTNLVNQSAGFLFADAGFDVWMGNARGNTYSVGHVKYSRSKKEYWAFTWDDISEYDLPAMIDYALNVTNERQLYYVGYSEGTLTMFAKLASDQSFASKIRKFFALGPIGTVTYIKGLIRSAAKNFMRPLTVLARFSAEFMANDSLFRKMSKATCSLSQIVEHCENLMFQMTGPATSQMNQEKPPVFNLTLVNAPVYLYWSDADWLADKRDVENAKMAIVELNASEFDICQVGIFTQDQIDYRLMGNMPISIFGMLTNMINIIVFAHPEMRPSLVNHFLLALSISDLLLLLCNFFFLLFPVIAVMSTSFMLHDLYPTVLRYSYPLARTAQTCGVYLTLFVSVHRFLGVCHPFRAKRWVTRTPVKCAIFGSVLFSVLINLTTWLELAVVPCYNNWFKRMSRHITLTELQEDYTYAVMMKVITYTFVMFVIPFLTLIIVNCRIIIALRRSSNLRQQHTNTTPNVERNERLMNQFRLLEKTKYSSLFSTFMKLNNSNALRTPANSSSAANANSVRDRSVTLMLLAIVAMFLECNGLAFCNNIVEILIFVDKIDSKSTESLFESSVEIANILVSLNSSTSIIVYLIFSSKYRTIIKQFLGLEERRKVNGVALTAAMVAHRAFELSIIPNETEARRRGNDARLRRANFRRSPAKTLESSDSHFPLAENGGESIEGRDRAHLDPSSHTTSTGSFSPTSSQCSPLVSHVTAPMQARRSTTRCDTIA